MSNTIVCDTFRAEATPDGRFLLEIFSAPKTPAGQPNRRLQVPDVIGLVLKLTGKEVAAGTVYRWAKRRNNRLPSHKVVGGIFFIEEEVTRWLRGWCNPEAEV